MNLAQDIKNRLDEIGKSQRWLALKIGMSPTKINLVLNGKRELKIKEYQHICWALKVSTGEFLKPESPKAV